MMPILPGALAALMSGNRPQNIEDLLSQQNPMLPLETNSGGALVDQRVPSVQTKPPLQLQDQSGYDSEQAPQPGAAPIPAGGPAGPVGPVPTVGAGNGQLAATLAQGMSGDVPMSQLMQQLAMQRSNL
jgi:hypothetical protein